MNDKIKDVTPESVFDLIRKMKKGVFCLPSFQRDFVWKPAQMALLVESVVRHYPIGTIICLRYIENRDLGKNSFVGTAPSAFRPKYYVIDGQQRLRTFLKSLDVPNLFVPNSPLEGNGRKYKLYYKIDINPHNLPLNVDSPSFVVPEITEDGDSDDYVQQGRERLIPLEYALSRRHTETWFKVAYAKEFKILRQYRRNVTEFRKKIETYACPVEYLIRKLSSQDHANIFKLLNEGGTDLTSFDLINAHLNPYHINIRELWKQSDSEHSFSRDFDLDPVFILKVMLLIRGTYSEDGWPTCTKQDLKRIPLRYGIRKYSDVVEQREFHNEFRRDWVKACKYTHKALDSIRWDYGAPQKKFIPYTPMIITLAAILWWIEDYMRYDEKYKSGLKDKIRHWYWGSIFKKTYEKHTDNQVAHDYYYLKDYLKIGNRKKIPSEIKLWKSKSEISDSLESIDSSGDARYKAVLCLPLIKGAEDIYSQDFLLSSTLHDHHIYPRKCAEVVNIPSEEVNQVFNRMLITDKTNQEIKNKSPYDYLSNCSRSNLMKHYLWPEIHKDEVSFRDFASARKERIVARLYSLINH